MVAFTWRFARSERYCAVSGTKYSSDPGNGAIPIFLQCWYNSTDAAMFPWSVIASAGCPIAAARDTIASTVGMASFTLYRLCACRCQNGIRSMRGVRMILIPASRSSWWVVSSTDGAGGRGERGLNGGSGPARVHSGLQPDQPVDDLVDRAQGLGRSSTHVLLDQQQEVFLAHLAQVGLPDDLLLKRGILGLLAADHHRTTPRLLEPLTIGLGLLAVAPGVLPLLGQHRLHVLELVLAQVHRRGHATLHVE